MVLCDKEEVVLNLGCGPVYKEGMINVDKSPVWKTDAVVDLNLYPWYWEANSVDGIYMWHVLEHLEDVVGVLKECHRILKVGGWLHIGVPHASCINAQGNLEHTGRLFTTASFDFLTSSNYLFGECMFKQDYLKIRWFQKGYKSMWLVEWLPQLLINLSPKCFERGWCYLVGGANGVEWKGTKV